METPEPQASAEPEVPEVASDFYRDGSPVEYDADGNTLADLPDEYYDDPEAWLVANPEYAPEPEVEETPAPVVAAPRPVAPVVAAQPAPAPKPAYVAPPPPAVTILPPMTEAEEAALNELSLTNPIGAQRQLMQRELAEQRAGEALAEYQEDIAANKYPEFYKENRSRVNQMIRELTPQQRTNPDAASWAVAGVTARLIYETGDPVAVMKKQLALLEGGSVGSSPLATLVAPKPAAQRKPALAPGQRTPASSVPAGSARNQGGASPSRNIPANVKALMEYQGLTRNEAERALNELR